MIAQFRYFLATPFIMVAILWAFAAVTIVASMLFIFMVMCWICYGIVGEEGYKRLKGRVG